MAKILTPVNTLHEHYLFLQYSSVVFPRLIARIDVTAATTVSLTAGAAADVTAVASANFAIGTKEAFISVDGVTDAATDCVVTLKDGITTIGTVTVPAHAGIDSLHKIVCTAAFTAAPALTVTITGGTAGVTYSVLVIDDSVWKDLGQNFTEGMTFADGAMTMPVARGWDATAFSKRTRSQNSWSIHQLYCSQFEGTANLRGKTICIKDEVHVDGGAIIKEKNYVEVAQVQNLNQGIGTSGQEQADTVDCSGFYKRAYTYTLDATALTAMA